MKKLLPYVVIILITILATIAIREYLKTPVYPYQVVIEKIDSGILKEPRELIVPLPVPYDSTVR